MNVLIIHAHPEPTSFNAAMRDVAVATLQEEGHGVLVSDLYPMGFHAVLGANDFIGDRLDANVLNAAAEQTNAYANGTLAPDIIAEQAKVAAADLVIFQFPIWWFGMPAIMKGWADRVFTRGFAYDAGRKYDNGLFRGKTATRKPTTAPTSGSSPACSLAPASSATRDPRRPC